MAISRRGVGAGIVYSAVTALAMAPGAAAGAQPAIDTRKPFAPKRGARCRVMIVNDIAGDPDGLYAVVHALLSPAAEVRGFVGGGADGESQSPKRSVEAAAEILRLMNMTGKVPLHEGLIARFKPATPPRSPGVQAIIDEALRDDTDLPLFVTVGGALTEVASALAIEPRIADRMTVVWIGGRPHAKGGADEFNYSLDPAAVQYVFNDSRVRIWQIPSDVYGMCIVSNTELQLNVAPYGAIGAWLYAKTIEVAESLPFNTGETWTLGDSPLVVLTALTNWFPSSAKPLQFELTGSSAFEEKITPRITAAGTYEPRSEGRLMRVYTTIDTRMMHADLFAKLKLHYGSS